MKVKLTCCMCDDETSVDVDIPGWNVRYGYGSIEGAFCPRHAIIESWADAQCSGCVGGFSDCDLWRKFAFDHSKGLTVDDYTLIEKGICPCRTNGTMIFNQEVGCKPVNLSETATIESGICLATAIREYWNKYHTGGDRCRE